MIESRKSANPDTAEFNGGFESEFEDEPAGADPGCVVTYDNYAHAPFYGPLPYHGHFYSPSSALSDHRAAAGLPQKRSKWTIRMANLTLSDTTPSPPVPRDPPPSPPPAPDTAVEEAPTVARQPVRFTIASPHRRSKFARVAPPLRNPCVVSDSDHSDSGNEHSSSTDDPGTVDAQQECAPPATYRPATKERAVRDQRLRRARSQGTHATHCTRPRTKR